MSLPPISSQDFDVKVAAIQETSDLPHTDSPLRTSCAYCDKAYGDLKSYQKHLKSRKHIQRFVETESGEDVALERTTASPGNISLDEEQAPSDSDEGGGSERSVVVVVESFIPFKCLFCAHDCMTLDLNLEHMQKAHGMFIPDREYLIDVETFVGYLHTIISEFNECLYCGHVKHSAEAIRQHMLDKGHCKLKTDETTEYDEFYEFPPCTDDTAGHSHGGGTKNAATLEIAKGFDSTQQELHLPSGHTVGHRLQPRSGRQNPRSQTKSPERQAIAATSADTTTTRAAAEAQAPPRGRQLVTRARGELGMIGVSDHQKRALRAVEKKMLNAEIRARNQYLAAVEKAANRQKFFKVSRS